MPADTVDMVNHPPHYKGPTHIACGQPIECIDVIRGMPFSVASSVKYVWRAGKKVIDRTAREAEIEDIRKAIWYLHDRIAELEREDD